MKSVGYEKCIPWVISTGYVINAFISCLQFLSSHNTMPNKIILPIHLTGALPVVCLQEIISTTLRRVFKFYYQRNSYIYINTNGQNKEEKYYIVSSCKKKEEKM